MRWRVIPFRHWPAAMNMALDEAISEAVGREESPPTMRFYGWEPSAVSIGCFQGLEEEVDLERCRERGIDVVRRRTGAGAVFHDKEGEITYSVVCPMSMMEEDITASYRTVCGWIIEALDMLGLKAEFQPINDVLINGRKVSGSAQTRRGGVFLQHGTLLFDLDPEIMFSVLRVSKEKISDKMIELFHERVTSILRERPIDKETVLEAMTAAFTKEKDWEYGDFSAAELMRAEVLAIERYSDDQWTRSR